MSFWNEQRPMTGMCTGDEEKMQCRFCAHAQKEHIGAGRCEEYPDEKGKPRDVYFDNAPCPKFDEGEDLLPFEIKI